MFGVVNRTTTKNNIKCIMAFGSRWLIILHTTTNQKWAGAGEEKVEKRDKRRGVAEDANVPCLCVEGERGQRTTSSAMQVAGS